MDQRPTDEINLQDLAVTVIRYFRKNFRFVAICSIVGISTGVVGWFSLPKVYESKMILMSDILTESYSERLTESLDNLIKEKNLKVISTRLSLSEAEALEIKEIEIESIKKTKEPGAPEETIFIVTANIGDRAILAKLQNGIIEYLRNNEFVKIRVKQREVFYRALIDKIGEEIRSLDSLKARLFEGKPVYARTSEMLLVDPTNIYTKIIDLSKEQINYKNELELVNSIQLVEGFTVFEKPASPKLSIMLIGGLILGFSVAITFLTLQQLNKLAD